MQWLPSRFVRLTSGKVPLPLLDLCQPAAGAAALVAGLLPSMYTTRLYSGSGGKPGRRVGLVSAAPPLLENHHPHHPPNHHQHHHHHHPPASHPLPHHAQVPPPPPQNYPSIFQSRLDGHRPHYVPLHHQHYHTHAQPPPPPPQQQQQQQHLALPHYQQASHLHHHHHNHHHLHHNNHHSKKKSWNFIHDKMSYDTFFTMKRLIDRSRSVDEVLRWVTQNPGKISHNHYPIALQKIGQLLLLQHSGIGATLGTVDGILVVASPAGTPGGENPCRVILENPDFQTLCNAIVNDCSKFDNFSIVNCLYAVAALGLPSDSEIVQVLEAESQGRMGQFNQKDVSMVFSSSMRLHPSSQHPLIEACLGGLEKNIERERHPQTLFLLLSYYRTKWRHLQAAAGAATGSETSSPEQLLLNRKILRLVKHTLASVSSVRDHEMALLDEMLSACVREASNKSLELIFSSHLFYQNRQERFIISLAEELPKKAESITPYTMALISKYVARHRLRETRLLDTIADFLVKKGEYLDSKVIQKLVFPFSRMSYRPTNEGQFFSKLESVLELKALSSPLATVNILMSLFQLGHFPGLVLHRVFSASFISNVTNSPYALIVRRYLSLLDAAVELEYRDYSGPRLHDSHKVLMFDHALTADEVNRKYSYKGLVAEALRQLVGEHGYKQDEVLAPGYYTDFLLLIDSSGRVLPVRQPSSDISLGVASKSADGSSAVVGLTSDFQKFSPFSASAPLEDVDGKQPVEDSGYLPPPPASSHMRPPVPSPTGPNGAGVALDYNPYYPPTDYYASLAKEHSLESQDSSTLSSPSDCLTQAGTAGTGGAGAVVAGVGDGTGPGGSGPDSLFQFSIGKILEEEGGAPIPTGAPQGPDCELSGFYEGVAFPKGAEGELGPASPIQMHPTDCPEAQRGNPDATQIKRVIMSVNDKWHYCHNSDVLVGSRAMRDRHLHLLGYIILQLPYLDLEKLNGIEEVKQYLHKKLLEVPL